MADDHSGKGKTMRVRTWRHKAAVAFSALALAATVSLGGAITSPEPASAAAKCVNYNYSNGGYSTCVGYIQQLLNFHAARGAGNKVVVDNAFGPKTRDSVKKFQKTFGLKVDGIVGPQTWRILCYPQMGPGPIKGFPYAASRAAGC